VSVTMQSATAGSSIYYTTDGSTPTQSSALYTGAMTLTSSATMKAAAFKSGYNPSAVAAASFTNTISGTTGTGKNYYVAKNGSNSNSCTQAQNESTPKLTITAGIACLSPGDTLQVKAGNYPELISTNISTIPTGTSYSNATTIQGFGSDLVTVKNITMGSPNPGQITQYIVFKNLIIDASGQHDCISLGGGGGGGRVQFIKIDNINCSNAMSSGIYLGGENGAGTDLWVTNSRVHHNGTANDGISHHGIYVETSNNLIEGTEIDHNPGYGIHQIYGPGTIGNNVYRYNYIHDNVFTGQNVFGIVLNSRNNNQVYHNTIANNHNGILVDVNSSGNLIYNNTIYGNGLGFVGSVCCYEAMGINSSANTVKNNIVYNNAINSIRNAGTGNVISNNLTIDPKFIDASAGNFRLQSSSPAIDAGTANIATGITILFSGSAPDIGALEY
jgi:hypothetical protein